MNDVLIKSYDIIKEEQRNSDAKANIFIVIISAFFAFVSDIPATLYTQEQLNGMQYLFLFLLFPLLLLVWSLIPIYSNKFNFKKKKYDELNIFYWKSIIQFSSCDVFIEKYSEIYNTKKIEKDEIDLLKQIYVNANILENKAFTHKTAFYILGHIVLFIVIGLIAEYIIGYNFWILLIFIFLELIYTNKVFVILTKLNHFGKKKDFFKKQR